MVTSSIAPQLPSRRDARTDGSRAGPARARQGAAGPAGLLPATGLDRQGAPRVRALAVPVAVVSALRGLRHRPVDPVPRSAGRGERGPRHARAVPRLAGAAPARADVALIPVAGLR